MTISRASMLLIKLFCILKLTDTITQQRAASKCTVVINFFDSAHKVTVTEDTCDNCQSAIIDVTFNKNKTPLENDKVEHSGCVFCDPVFKPLMATKHIAARTARRGGGGGRGRGSRGRGGKGRGGRSKPPKDKMAQLASYFV